MKTGWVLIVGSLQHGAQAIGPFERTLDAYTWAEKHEYDVLAQDPMLDVIFITEPEEMEREYQEMLGELCSDDEIASEDEDCVVGLNGLVSEISEIS